MKKHFTNLTITNFYETILGRRDTNLSVSSVFLNSAKVLDAVNHEIIKLYGVRGIPLESHLRHWCQQIWGGILLNFCSTKRNALTLFVH